MLRNYIPSLACMLRYDRRYPLRAWLEYHYLLSHCYVFSRALRFRVFMNKFYTSNKKL